jgi:hypothetical protein
MYFVVFKGINYNSIIAVCRPESHHQAATSSSTDRDTNATRTLQFNITYKKHEFEIKLSEDQTVCMFVFIYYYILFL